jgi:phosphonopyruvate decarboxylase
MLDAIAFINILKTRGYSFFSGVPCSFLTPLIDQVATRDNGRYVGATSEGEAIAIAAGAWLAGHNAVVLSQNSGLGNMVNPLTSLNHPFRIPVLLVVTLRGEPGIGDEPQHELMGKITSSILDLMGINWRIMPDQINALETCVDEGITLMSRLERPFAFIVRQNSFLDNDSRQPPIPSRSPGRRHDVRTCGPRPSRMDVLERLLSHLPPEVAVIATTGKCARELFTLADRPQHLYMVGAMGSASAVGLGVALHSQRPVVVLDGDGAALMRLGTFATIGATGPANLIHIVLDNGVHDSTGGQRTVSDAIDLGVVGTACGYAEVFSCDSIEGVASALDQTLQQRGPHLVHARLAPGSIKKLGRPTLPPHEVARRFAGFLAGNIRPH